MNAILYPLNLTQARSIPNRRFASHILVFFFILLSLQNVIAIILSSSSPLASYIVLMVKDVVMYIAVIVISLRTFVKLCIAQDVAVALLVFIILLVWSVFSAGIVNALSVRQIWILPLFYIFGSALKRGIDLSIIESRLPVILIVIAISAWIDRFLLHDSDESFWAMLGIGDFMRVKGVDLFAFGPGGVPGNYYTYDLYALTGSSFRRAVGTITDPTQLGQIMVFPIVYFALRRQFLIFLIFFITLLITFSKSGLICLLLALILHFISKIKNRLIKRLLLATMPVTLLISFLLMGVAVGADSILAHMEGLIGNMSGIIQAPFGHGIGSVGNFAALSETSIEDNAGESYFGTLIGQVGIFGMLVYFGFIWLVWTRCCSNTPFTSAAKHSTIAMLIAGFGSESAVSYVGSGFLLPIIPLILNRKFKQ